MTRVEIRPEPLDGELAVDLIVELDADLHRRYGGGEAVHAPAEEFLPPDGLFLVALIEGAPVACGGFRRIAPKTAELKRMYVRPRVRGQGLARLLVGELEVAAAATGYRELWLETGLEQPEAMALYESAGYLPIPPFGQFAWSRRNRCYGKALT